MIFIIIPVFWRLIKGRNGLSVGAMVSVFGPTTRADIIGTVVQV